MLRALGCCIESFQRFAGSALWHPDPRDRFSSEKAFHTAQAGTHSRQLSSDVSAEAASGVASNAGNGFAAEQDLGSGAGMRTRFVQSGGLGPAATSMRLPETL